MKAFAAAIAAFAVSCAAQTAEERYYTAHDRFHTSLHKGEHYRAPTEHDFYHDNELDEENGEVDNQYGIGLKLVPIAPQPGSPYPSYTLVPDFSSINPPTPPTPAIKPTPPTPPRKPTPYADKPPYDPYNKPPKPPVPQPPQSYDPKPVSEPKPYYAGEMPTATPYTQQGY